MAALLSQTWKLIPPASEIDSLAFDFYLRPSEEDPQIDAESVLILLRLRKMKEAPEIITDGNCIKMTRFFSDPEYLVLPSDRFFDGNAYQMTSPILNISWVIKSQWKNWKYHKKLLRIPESSQVTDHHVGHSILSVSSSREGQSAPSE